jgi:hypothetical protein
MAVSVPAVAVEEAVFVEVLHPLAVVAVDSVVDLLPRAVGLPVAVMEVSVAAHRLSQEVLETAATVVLEQLRQQDKLTIQIPLVLDKHIKRQDRATKLLDKLIKLPAQREFLRRHAQATKLRVRVTKANLVNNLLK